MKNITILCFVSILCACSSNYEKQQSAYAVITKTTDPNLQLKLLEQRQKIECAPAKNQNLFYKRECAGIWRGIAGTALTAKKFPLALQAVNNAHHINPPQDRLSLCGTGWDHDFIQHDTWEQALIARKRMGHYFSFAMIQYQALKANSDSKAKDFLDIAYMCELDGDSDQRVELLQNYLKDSAQVNNIAEQTNVKKFINEIYVPLEHAKQGFYIGSGDEKSKILYSARLTLLYRHAVLQAKKIDLPQVYQDYLQYYAVLYNYRNKK